MTEHEMTQQDRTHTPAEKAAPPADRPAYRRPRVQELGGAEQIQDRCVGNYYDGPARWLRY